VVKRGKGGGGGGCSRGCCQVVDRKGTRCVCRGGLGWERVKVIGPGVVSRGEGLITREFSSAAGFGRFYIKSNFEQNLVQYFQNISKCCSFIYLLSPAFFKNISREFPA
jgi:hypothetical protein